MERAIELARPHQPHPNPRVGAVIVVTNEALMFGMWEDPMGRRLLIGAFVLQVVGSFGLYRLSRLE